MTIVMTSSKQVMGHTRLGVRARRLLALILMVAFSVAWAASGRSYLWCVSMQRVMATCCVQANDHVDVGEPPHGPAARSECCEERSIDALPIVDAHQAPFEIALAATVAPTPVVPVLNPGAGRSASVESLVLPRHPSIRAAPRSASERCVALQVFRC